MKKCPQPISPEQKEIFVFEILPARGGGGSSYTSGSSTTNTAGSGTTPPNSGDSSYISGIGSGGAAMTMGGDGLLVISY